jgi:hypothetical protein
MRSAASVKGSPHVEQKSKKFSVPQLAQAIPAWQQPHSIQKFTPAATAA